MEEGGLRSIWLQARKIVDDARAAIVGVVAVAVLAWVVSHLSTTITLPDWVLVLVFAVLLVGVALLYWQLRGRRKIQKRFVELISLDESLLALFPSFVRDIDQESAIERLLHETLRDSTRLLGEHVSRAFILRKNDQHELVPWVTYEMSSESKARTRFSTESGPERNRGVAGETYQDRTLRVVHMVKRDGGWRSEVFKQEHDKWVRDEETKYLVFAANRPHPPYRSFVTVPIMATSQDCLGVLCFDSANQKIFDQPEMRQLLISLSTRIAAVIYTQRAASEASPTNDT
jgi:hypothetical protein